MASHPKTFLIVLDGFGDGKDYPFNAIKNAKMPFYRELCSKFPRSQLLTCGEAVGLPAGIMGNSEVGHTNIGAGRIVYQELTRINRDIRNGDFKNNKEIIQTIDAAASKGGRVHLLGLLSDAGVHSHTDHLKALLEMIHPKVPATIHIFSDGRDTPPTSVLKYINELGEVLKKYPGTVFGSLSGRYFAMDRDQRWDRVEKAWKVLVGESTPYSFQDENGVKAAFKAAKESIDRNVTDEFIEPVLFNPKSGRATIEDGDAILFYNFRSDRARELTRAFTENNFSGFTIKKRPKLSRFLCFTQYDKNFGLPVAFLPQNLDHILPDVFSENKLKQFRIAETEKYAHVTFFFNGGRELVYPGEDRVLIPSPKDVATYDLKPEMSAPEVTAKLTETLKAAQHEFVLVNYANPDMIGHTGNYDAAIKAMQVVDDCLNKTVSTALNSDYTVMITADHGNIEEMRDEHDHPHTQHTLNPVPFHFISKTLKPKCNDGVLADIAPTILKVMGLPIPKEMTGKVLIK